MIALITVMSHIFKDRWIIIEPCRFYSVVNTEFLLKTIELIFKP